MVLFNSGIYRIQMLLDEHEAMETPDTVIITAGDLDIVRNSLARLQRQA
jgi:hypothetical protein